MFHCASLSRRKHGTRRCRRFPGTDGAELRLSSVARYKSSRDIDQLAVLLVITNTVFSSVASKQGRTVRYSLVLR